MLECVVSNVPAGVCFVMTGSNVAFEVVQFDPMDEKFDPNIHDA